MLCLPEEVSAGEDGKCKLLHKHRGQHWAEGLPALCCEATMCLVTR